MDTELDHILWAAPDLDQGSALMESLVGVAPGRGGSHPDIGTRNSLLSLGDTYLEILAPDPAQALDGTRGAAIAVRAEPGLIMFAMRTRDLAAYAAAAGRAGVRAIGPVEMSRTRPDGVHLAWACLYMDHPVFGEMVPFAIDWQSSPHPAATTPPGCRLLELVALHPRAPELAEIYRIMGIPVEVRRAAKPGFLATLETPNGKVVLTS